MTLPSIDLDCRTGVGLPAGAGFARASAGCRTTPGGLIELVAAGQPRLDHEPLTGQPLGWLIEEAATNLLASPENFAAPWTALSVGITPDAAIAPNGLMQADRMTETILTDQHAVGQTISKPAASQTYTASVFIKAAGRNNVQISLRNGANGARFNFDLTSAGFVSSNAFGAGWTARGASIKAYPGGWFRIAGTADSDATTAIRAQVRTMIGAVETYAGDGLSGALLWGAMLVEGGQLTSYIPDSRQADVLTVAAAGGAGGALLARGRFPVAVGTGKTALLAQADAGADGDRLTLLHDAAAGGTRARVVANAATVATLGAGTQGVSDRHSLALGWTGGRVALSIGGGAVASAAGLAPPVVTTLRAGRQAGGGGAPMILERLAWWPGGLGDAGLQAAAGFPPATPVGLAGRLDKGVLTLGWSNPNPLAVTQELEAATDSGFGAPFRRESFGAATTAASFAVDANRPVYCRLRAVNGEGASAWSASYVLLPFRRGRAVPADNRRTSVALS